MKNVFDHWGSASHKDYKSGYKDTTRSEWSCHKRAGELFKSCGNGDRQPITATYTLKNGVTTSYTFPPPERCGTENVDCLASKKGTSYTGTVSKTKTGRTCQRWDTKSPHIPHYNKGMKHNYCRNTDGEDTVWCYTMDKEERWEYCEVPECTDC